MTVHEQMFDKLIKIGIIDNAGTLQMGEYLKIESKPYMPLSIDRLPSEQPGTIRISMAHNYEQNGDLMCDPDMEILIAPAARTVEALTFQQDSLGIYQVVYPEPGKVHLKLKTDLNRFLNQWLSNLIDQGFRVLEPVPVTT